VGEELEIESAPFGVASHRVERVIGGDLGALAGRLDIVLISAREDLAQVLRAFGAAAVEQLEEQLLFVGEVVVDRAAAEARVLRDRVEAGGVKAAFGEYARRRSDQLLARFLASFGLGQSLAFHA